jgi:hypothetical protein
MDHDRELERRTYRLCRLGFGLLGLALVLASATWLLQLPSLFVGRLVLPWLQHSAFWKWLDAPIVWGSLVGTYLLWGRWRHPGWQRRAGFLLVMGMVDGVMWLIEHGETLGLRTGDFGHEWVRFNLGHALGWAELALIAALSAEVLVHLGVEAADETSKATRSLIGAGAALWMVKFCLLTDWHGGWPLMVRRVFRLNPVLMLLEMGATMTWTIALLQVTALSIAATRQCTWVLAEMDREDLENDPLRPSWDRDGFRPPGFDLN